MKTTVSRATVMTLSQLLLAVGGAVEESVVDRSLFHGEPSSAAWIQEVAGVQE